MKPASILQRQLYRIKTEERDEVLKRAFGKGISTLLVLSLLLSVMATQAWADGAVAKIGEDEYATLQEAFAAAQDGDTITLQANCPETPQLTLNNGYEVTIDLSGHTISGHSRMFMVEWGTLTFTGTGRIEESMDSASAPLVVKGSTDPGDSEYAVLNVGEDVTIKGRWYGPFITPNGSSAYGAVINMDGILEACGLYVNGSIKATEGNLPVVNVGPTAQIDSAYLGLYAAGYALYNIADGAQVAGDLTGIEIRAGELNIAGGTVTGGTDELEVNPNGNGSTTANCALAVAQHTTKRPIQVNVTGGDFAATAAINVTNPQGNSAEDLAQIELNVSGGVFEGALESVLTDYRFITGGSFSQDPSAFVPEDVAITEVDGLWIVGELPPPPQDDDDDDSDSEQDAEAVAERAFWEELKEAAEELADQIAEATDSPSADRPILTLDVSRYDTIPFWAVNALAGQDATLTLTYADAYGKKHTLVIDCAEILKTERNRVFYRIEDFVALYAGE
jgi:hypothetical protein